MAQHHHSSLAANRDYLAQADKGDLVDPHHSAGFTVDPLLTPITSSALPHPILPDPTPSSDPALFDASTRHPNTHYHHERQLSKKKRNKKLGLGAPIGPPATGGLHAGGRTFSEREQVEHERAERRDAELGHEPRDALHEDEDEEGDDDHEEHEGGESHQEAVQSHVQHAENRVTGKEVSGQHLPVSKPAPKPPAADQDKDGSGDSGQQQGKEGNKGEEGGEQSNPSLMQRAGNLLSSAQERAAGALASASGTVGGLLNKVGLSGQKIEADPADENAQAKKEETET